MYYSWDTRDDATLFLEVVQADGSGLTGSTPKVAIKRIKELSGNFLDNYYWNSASFVSTPTFLTMSQVDSVNNPGLYTYCFSQSLIALERVYSVYYKHEVAPIGFSSETHFFVNSVSGSIKVYETEPEV